MADLAQEQPLETDSVFQIGSISKLFTAVILLQLAEEGALALDDPLGKWLPEMAAVLPNGEALTLRQLASHTAGVNEYERDLYPMPQLLQRPCRAGPRLCTSGDRAMGCREQAAFIRTRRAQRLAL